MKYVIAHECRGRIRIRIDQKHMSLAQADLLEAWLQRLNGVQQAVVHERTCCAVIRYSGTRADLLQAISRFRYDAEDVETLSNVHSGRAISRLYQEKLVDLVCFKLIRMVFFPQPLRILWTIKTAVPYVFRGLRCLLRGQLHVELLDGLSIAVSILRMDFSTADSVMFLLRLGELLEEWTHKKSVDDLARCMSLNVRPRLAENARRRGSGSAESGPPRRSGVPSHGKPDPSGRNRGRGRSHGQSGCP